MKYLEYTPLDHINDFLCHVNLGESTIKGCLEAYSCKHTGMDKRLSLSLDHEILDYFRKPSDSNSCSLVDYVPSKYSRKTLIYLILTLYHMNPDYDFSATKFHQFFSEEGWDSFKQIFDNYMFELLRKWKEAYEGSLFENLCKALNLIVKSTATILNLMLTHFLREEPCKIFLLWSVHGFGMKLPFYEQGFLCFARWSFTFFFYNRKLKRVVSFRLCQISNLVAEHFPMEDKKILMKWVSELET